MDDIRFGLYGDLREARRDAGRATARLTGALLWKALG
jgi:hypothetical protein